MTPLKQQISLIPFSIEKGDNTSQQNVDCCNNIITIFHDCGTPWSTLILLFRDIVYSTSITRLPIIWKCSLCTTNRCELLNVDKTRRVNALDSKGNYSATSNKYIRNVTKAAARQNPNCIKNQKNKMWRKTIFNMANGIITPCNVACGSGIVYIWFWFWPYHRSRHVICTSLRNFIQIEPPSAEKNDVMSIFKMADFSHLEF